MSRAVTSIKGLTPYDLADMADVASPDNLKSAGAEFLTSIRDDVMEAWEREEFDDEDRGNDGDRTHEIADAAPDIYSHRRMLELIDLAAYNEEIEAELVGSDPTMIDLAGLALYQVAERLVAALLEELRTELAEQMEVDADRQPTWAEADAEYLDSLTPDEIRDSDTSADVPA